MNKLRSNSGFGIIEILIAFGLVGILTAVMTTLFTNIQKQQRQANIVASVTSMRDTIAKMLNDGRAWRNTIADPTNVNTTCLLTRDGTCPHITAPLPVSQTSAYYDAAPFLELPILRDASSPHTAVPALLPYINTSVATAGFTNSGTPCNTFDMANGNDQCPIRWEIRMQYTCPAPAVTCTDPTVRVVAFMYYRPAANSDLASVINENRFFVDIIRGAQGENRSERIEIVSQSVPGGAPNAATGGGVCLPGGWQPIILNTILVDTGNNVVSIAGADITLAAGTYNCSATTSCFSCRTLQMRLINVDAGVVITSPGTAGPSATMLNVTANYPDLRANGPTRINLDHGCGVHPDCTLSPGPGACPMTWGMGMAIPNYSTPTIYSSLICTRIF